jgi:hypothetical protein
MESRPDAFAVGKVFERIVFKEVFNHLISNDLLYKFQSGFIPGHSTVHQLIEIYYRICMALNDHCITTLILCDISKASEGNTNSITRFLKHMMTNGIQT